MYCWSLDCPHCRPDGEREDSTIKLGAYSTYVYIVESARSSLQTLVNLTECTFECGFNLNSQRGPTLRVAAEAVLGGTQGVSVLSPLGVGQPLAARSVLVLLYGHTRKTKTGESDKHWGSTYVFTRTLTHTQRDDLNTAAIKDGRRSAVCVCVSKACVSTALCKVKRRHGCCISCCLNAEQ